MSSGQMQGRPSNSNSTSNAPQTTSFARPIDIVPDQVSQLYAHIHPIVLISLPYFSFRTLVNDPVACLSGWAPAIAILQFVYCVLCLPATGQKAGTKKKKILGATGSKAGGNSAVGAASDGDVGTKIVPATFSLLLTLTLATPLLGIAVVLFGAPVTTHHAETALVALLLALLATPPLFFAHGLDADAWRRLTSLSQPVDEIYGLALGTFVGAWLGAIPIPLDWDRDWQRWPVTVIIGAFAGAAVGKFIGGWVLKGRTMKIS